MGANNKCDICGQEELMPFKCRYCGGTYCANHRLPERHDCSMISHENKNQSSWKTNTNNYRYNKQRTFDIKRLYIWRYANKYQLYIIIGVIVYFIAGLILTIIQSISGFINGGFVLPLFSNFGYAGGYDIYVTVAELLSLFGILLILYSLIRIILRFINKQIKCLFRGRNYYSDKNKGLAAVGLIMALISIFLPWLNLELFGESLGGISLYYILMNFDSYKNTLISYRMIHNSNDLLTIYGSIALFIFSSILALFIIALWKSHANKIWVPGALAIGSFLLWYMSIQNTGYFNILQSGFDIGLGCWLLLIAAGIWIWANMSL